VDISFNVCGLFFCMYVHVQLQLELAASNFAREFIGIQGRE